MSTPGKPSLRKVPLRRILGLARPEWHKLALGTVFLLVSSAAGLIFPQAIRLIIDEALHEGRRETIDRLALGMAAIFFVQAVTGGLRYMLYHTAGESIVIRLREQFYRRLMDQEIAFFDECRTGELTSRLASDTTVLQSAVSSNISIGLRHLTFALGGTAFLFYTSPKLAMVMLVVIPPVALGAVAYGRYVRKLSRQVQEAFAEANHIAAESLAGIRTVRLFAAEEQETQRYKSFLSQAFNLARRRALASASFMASSSFGGYISAVLVFWYGGRLVVARELTVGGLTSFLVYTLLVAMALGSLSDVWADFMRALGSAERVFEFIDRVPTLPPSGGARLAATEGRLEFQGVRFSYPTRRDLQVFKELDLSIAPGEVVAIVGPSGAGKSTLAALLSRLYDPDAGRILLDGRDLKELDPRWLRQQIGVVSQEPILFSGSIADNIRYGRPDATDAEVEAAARTAHAHEFISRFPQGYKTLVGERGVQLSGGQKQRVAIARAVLKAPRLLVLDEATSALDAESEHLVKDALDHLMKGRTTLVIAHRLSTVSDADLVVVLDGGRIIQHGSHTMLVEQDGLYRRLVERQFVAA